MLPPLAGRPPVVDEPDADDAALVREALRLRARWVQELTVRAAWELGRRLTQRGVLHEAADVGLLEPGRAVDPGERGDPTRRSRRPAHVHALRLSPLGLPPGTRRRDRAARAGGHARHRRRAGRRRPRLGPVHVGDGLPPEGAVLVVRHLQPQLASVLPRLAGLVSETGSPLSHLAILAREMNLPVVVGVPDAVSRFADGVDLVVDGSTGEVSTIEDQP